MDPIRFCINLCIFLVRFVISMISWVEECIVDMDVLFVINIIFLTLFY